MLQKIKPPLIKLRSRYSLYNSYKVSRHADFISDAIVDRSKIIIPANNKVRLAAGARLHKLSIQIRGENNELIIHPGTFVVGKIELFGNNNRLEIGTNSRIVGGSLIVHSGTSLTIGESCMMAEGVDIRTTDSHPIYNENGKIINPARGVIIHDRVWLARDVIVLKGSVIKNDCVVGIKSIVTGTIPPNSIAVGAPAKVVRSNITWSREYPENYEELYLKTA